MDTSPTVFESLGISRLNSEIPALSRYAANNFTNIFNMSHSPELNYTISCQQNTLSLAPVFATVYVKGLPCNI